MTWRGEPEPLSRRAWARVEARVFERIERGALLLPTNPPERSSRSIMLWSGAAALAIAASVLLWWRFEATPSVAAFVAAPAVAANAGDPTPPPSSSVTPVEAPLEMARTRIVTTLAPTQTMLGEAELLLGARSELTFSGSDRTGWWVGLVQGQVDCHVTPRLGRPAFVVEAGEAQVTVVGTRFTVRRQGDAISVSVTEGHVRVTSGSVESMLGPGEAWSSPQAEPSRTERARPTPPRRHRKSATPRRSGGRERFARAARLEASDPEAALTLYRELAQSRDPWSANALYAQARLELERGATARARGLLLRYVERYPKGSNASDVRALLRQREAGR